MQINIHSKNFSLTDALRNYAKRRLSFSLTHKNQYIYKVMMRLSDINGPRGGTDKRCHLLVQLNGIPDVVVEDIQSDMYVSIDHACERASRTIVRKINRHQRLLRQARPFEFMENPIDETSTNPVKLITI